MEALTIKQPWASLIMAGIKHYETRGWKTSYRGKLAIHAGKETFRKFLRERFPVASNGYEYHPLYDAYKNFMDIVSPLLDLDNLQYGVVLGTVDLVDCLKVTNCDGKTAKLIPSIADKDPKYVSGTELMLGDFTEGRYAWRLENIKLFREPIPARGKQGMWNWQHEELIGDSNL